MAVICLRSCRLFAEGVVRVEASVFGGVLFRVVRFFRFLGFVFGIFTLLLLLGVLFRGEGSLL